ncbi:alpha/beta hydrolase [Myxococcota bacterium]
MSFFDMPDIPETTFEHSETTLHARDNTTLFAQRWQPKETAGEVLVIPGYGDHSGRYHQLAHNLARHHIATVAIDLRGHGKSVGRRGHISSLDDYHADVRAALSLLGTGPRFLLGHSQGGVIALDYIARHAPELAGLVVTNPFLELAMPVPAPKLWLGKVVGRIWPTLTMKNEIDPAYVSHDQAIIDAYARDPLVFRVTTARWFNEIVAAQGRVRAIRELPIPLLYIYSDADPIGKSSANEALADQLAATDKTVWQREGELHEVLNETDRAELHDKIGTWLASHAR